MGGKIFQLFSDPAHPCFLSPFRAPRTRVTLADHLTVLGQGTNAPSFRNRFYRSSFTP
jgi:hypothetical protein